MSNMRSCKIKWHYKNLGIKMLKNTVFWSCNKMPIHYPLLTLKSTHVCLFNLSKNILQITSHNNHLVVRFCVHLCTPRDFMMIHLCTNVHWFFNPSWFAKNVYLKLMCYDQMNFGTFLWYKILGMPFNSSKLSHVLYKYDFYILYQCRFDCRIVKLY